MFSSPSRFSLATFILALPLFFLGSARAQDETTAPAAPGTDVIEVVFDSQPVERGLTFSRKAVNADTLKVKDEEFPAWAARSTIEPTMGWTRSFRFKVTDPKFQNGNRPAVDIEVTYFQSANGPVDVRADTASGGRRIGGAWGNTTGWKTLKIRLDDAFFGARVRPDEKAPSVSGYDLRIDGVNSDLWLKSVRITGYSTTENINWNRMLKLENPRGETRGDLLVFGRGAAQKVGFAMQNLAAVARPVRYSLQITGYDDKVRFGKQGTTILQPSSSAPLPFVFDTRDWPLGPYDGQIAFSLDEKSPPILTQSFRLGVISDAVLPKARPGEFLFGLDAANTYIMPTLDETALAYYRLMGVDILRDLYSQGSKRDLEGAGAALQLLAKENLQGGIMIDPPREGSAEQKAKELAKTTKTLEEMARLYAGSGPGKLHFWEMGNEPDLPFFYPGSIAEYIESYSEMRDAIKRGAGANPTIVMNGGLSFAGPEGERRSREFIERIDPEKIDVLAYHGHGPGIGAERSAFERVKGVAQQWGKDNWAYIDTETGYSGRNRAGLERQASTVIEKFAYAQSQGLPTIYYFRLFMEGSGDEGGYGLTDNRVEPRPSILSYRHMVERLRHHKFVQKLDFDAESGTSGVQAFLFEERSVDGKPTGRKTLVAFSEKAAQYDLNVALDESGAVRGAQVFDLYGNALPNTALGSIAALRVSRAPLYLTWTSPGAIASVKVAPPLLAVQGKEPLLVANATSLTLLARNPGREPLSAELSIAAQSRLPLQVSPSQKSLSLAPGAALPIEIQATLGRSTAPLSLPRWWKVFLGVDAEKLTETSYAAIPDTLPGAKGTPAAPRFEWAENNRLDFGKMAGSLAEKRAAVAYATIDAPVAVALPAAASGDWWMAWYLNGRKVYDTLQTGNRGGTLADHTFDLPLQKGRNVLAVLVLSGSGGWGVEFGGPKERALAETGLDPDRLTISLQSKGQILAQQVVPLDIASPIALVEAQNATDELSDWQKMEPLTVLDESAVTNLFVKEPDESRWYGGARDLAAQIWLRDDGQKLHLFVSAADDKHQSAAKTAEGDHLRVVVASEGRITLLDATAALKNGEVVFAGRTAGATATIKREENGPKISHTLYHLQIPRALLGGKPFRLNLTLGDNDAGFLKQVLTLGDAEKPAAGVRLALP